MAASAPIACESCPVRDRAACSALSGDQRGELAALGRHRRLKRGETLFAAGEEVPACATLISGALKIASSDESGTERILSLVHPAGFVGELFAPVAHHDVVALTESEVCLFPARQYAEAIERFPALGRALLRRSAEDLYASRQLIDLMSRRTARQKVAGLLRAFADAASSSPCHPARRFDLPLSREEVAGLLGLTIETVSRQVTALERDGAIAREGSRGILLRDPVKLEAAAAA
ncbi:Crp/Fnr family transcriptional regulator [Sphingomonas mesophila]|uniref:Crp/Fnr family transcriptional regulator n=1 Tax=Sphingomonas mesophila TaxID=2303576 RepID=UPI000E59879D|nr:Crp/Fnr family transcriptional regulator [Sphingomonas mesophila]